MRRRQGQVDTRSALLITDPQAARQFGAQGSVLLWRDAPDSGLRRGLLCVPKACAHADCFAIHVWLGEVDSGLSSVSKTGNTFQFVRDADRADSSARVPISEAFASYDPDGGVAAVEGSERSPLVEWLMVSADADVLTHLRTPLLQRELAAGRVLKPRPAK